MTEENQKVMYDHFLRLSKEGTTDIQRAHCKQYAADILKSFPQFKESKKPEVPKETKPKEKKNG